MTLAYYKTFRSTLSLPRSRFFGCHVMLPQKKEERYVTSKKTAVGETNQPSDLQGAGGMYASPL